jgi:taurine dioxygenase
MSRITIKKLHPSVGAEVLGLEPRKPLDDDVVRELQAAFDEHSVLVFRDLDIDADFQRYLVYTLIREELPTTDDAASPRVQHVSNRAEGGAAPYGRLLFHCDNMFARTPQAAISLYGAKVEQPNAPTCFVSMGAAWDSLPDDLRARVEGSEARHGFDENRYPNRGGDEDVIDALFEYNLSTVRPIPFRHPRTGRELLYVAQQSTIEILGLSPQENEALLDEIYAHLYRPENVLEHQWREHDLVIFDNIALQHARGTVALEGPERTLRKITGPLSLEPDELEGLNPVHSKVARD